MYTTTPLTKPPWVVACDIVHHLVDIKQQIYLKHRKRPTPHLYLKIQVIRPCWGKILEALHPYDRL